MKVNIQLELNKITILKDSIFFKPRFGWVFYIISIFILLAFPINMPISNAEVDRDALGSGLGRFNSVFAGDIDDDGRCEIVIGNYEGYILVLEYTDYDFVEVWRSEKLGHRMWGITVADFVGDSGNEIIAGNGDGDLYAFDAKSYEQVWHATDLVRDVHGLLVHDLGSEDTKYLLAGTGYKTDKDLGTVYIFTGNSTDPIAQIGQFENRMRGLGVGDLDGDGALEIAVGSGVATGERPGEGYVRVYDVKGVLTYENSEDAREWKSDNLKGDCVSMELGDFDGDGLPDIVVGNGYRYQAGWVRVFTYDNTIKNYTEYWKSPDIGPKPYGLAVMDLDSDERLDIIVGNQPGYVYIYEQEGSSIKQVWKSGLLGTDILGICTADVDNDGDLEIIASQGGYIGKGDYTSGYSDPHIYIIDGESHEIEIVIGETHPLGFILEISVLVLIILLLLGLNYYLKFRRKVKDIQLEVVDSKVDTTSPLTITQLPYQTNARTDLAINRQTKTPISTTKPALVSTSVQPTTVKNVPINTSNTSTTQSAPVVNDPFSKPIESIEPEPPPEVNDPFGKTAEDNTTAKNATPAVNDPFKPYALNQETSAKQQSKKPEGGDKG